MKKLLLICGLLWTAVASAQFAPGQVLTAAQLNSQFALYAKLSGASFSGTISSPGIASSGPLTATSATFSGLVSVPGLTATGTISLPSASLPLSYLATQSSNTLVANVAGGTASPTAISAPSCSTSSSALQWTTNTGLACNTSINASTLGGVAAASYLTSASASTTYAPLASPVFSGTPTAPTAALSTNTTQIATTAFVLANAVTSSSPTITTPNIVGVVNGGNAAAGSVGEYQTATTAAVGATSFTALNSTVVSLTAGDWDVQCVATFVPAASTVTSTIEVGVSTNATPTFSAGAYSQISGTATAGFSQALASPTVRISLAATTFTYCPAQAGFSASTLTISGFIRARRVR